MPLIIIEREEEEEEGGYDGIGDIFGVVMLPVEVKRVVNIPRTFV